MCMYAGVISCCTYVCRSEVVTGPLPLLFFTLSSEAGSLVEPGTCCFWLEWLVSKSLQAGHLFSQCWNDRCLLPHTTLLHWFWASEPRCSSLSSRHITSRAISPALLFFRNVVYPFCEPFWLSSLLRCCLLILYCVPTGI